MFCLEFSGKTLRERHELGVILTWSHISKNGFDILKETSDLGYLPSMIYLSFRNANKNQKLIDNVFKFNEKNLLESLYEKEDYLDFFKIIFQLWVGTKDPLIHNQLDKYFTKLRYIGGTISNQIWNQIIEWLKKDMSEYYPDRCNFIGCLFQFQKKYEGALEWYSKAKTHSYALMNVGVIFDEGYIGSPHKDIAQKYFIEAIEKGNIPAMSYLGKLYLNKDYPKGIKLLIDVTNKGYIPAHDALIEIYNKWICNDS